MAILLYDDVSILTDKGFVKAYDLSLTDKVAQVITFRDGAYYNAVVTRRVKYLENVPGTIIDLGIDCILCSEDQFIGTLKSFRRKGCNRLSQAIEYHQAKYFPQQLISVPFYSYKDNKLSVASKKITPVVRETNITGDFLYIETRTNNYIVKYGDMVLVLAGD